MKNAFKRGFTLVELLVVVLIIGILSSVALPQYTKAVKKAKGTQIMTSVQALAKAMNMAYLEDGRYQRGYFSYSHAGKIESYDAGDFDIDVPALKINGESWMLAAGGSGNTADVCAQKVYEADGRATLCFNLSDGKIASVTCSGSECSSYFPGTMLSSN